MDPIASYASGTDLGVVEEIGKQSALDRAKKWCKDYKLPDAACAELINCLQSRSFETCIKAAVGAAVTAGCTAVIEMPKLCAGIGQFVASFVGTTGKITGCTLVKGRDLTAAPRTIAEAMAILNPGELLTYGRINKNSANRVWTWMLACDEGEMKMLDLQRMNVHIARRSNDWDKFVIAGKDWDDNAFITEEKDVTFGTGGQVYRRNQLVPWKGEPYRIDQVRVGESILPHLVQTGPRMIQATLLPISTPEYPEGSVAVLDPDIGKYRIIAPA